MEAHWRKKGGNWNAKTTDGDLRCAPEGEEEEKRMRKDSRSISETIFSVVHLFAQQKRRHSQLVVRGNERKFVAFEAWNSIAPCCIVCSRVRETWKNSFTSIRFFFLLLHIYFFCCTHFLLIMSFSRHWKISTVTVYSVYKCKFSRVKNIHNSFFSPPIYIVKWSENTIKSFLLRAAKSLANSLGRSRFHDKCPLLRMSKKINA